MTTFWVIAAALVVGALLWTAWPLLRRREISAGVGSAFSNRAILKDQLAELERDLNAATLAAHQYDEARTELERLQGLEPNHASVKRLAALLNFSDVIAAHPDVRSLRERAAANGSDLDLRHALAVHQLLGGDVEPALHTWLEMLRTHRSYKEDLARRSLLQAFQLVGDADPIVTRTRKEMARLLF